MGLCVGILNRKIGFRGIQVTPTAVATHHVGLYIQLTQLPHHSHKATGQAIARRTTPCKVSRELLQYLDLGVSTLQPDGKLN